ncbi:hypothetical protein AWB76_00194 [Caballeronia temeraria]|uniref:Uncharacterized protein n=1 Tax=Caballeronia temeraria TaxID=1777137 RepID=A0A157Z5P0_9BURK|nr:hypothetical protein [Caballeronia temeraria]SAK40649.1 hypothetical protein AWB76_00194 [Caballeronia temeraria]
MCNEISTNAASIAERHALRDYWRRMSALERAVLSAVRAGRKLTPADTDDAAVRVLVAAVLDLPQYNRGLNVANLFIDTDDAHAHWHLLVELDGGNRTLALVVPYPS